MSETSPTRVLTEGSRLANRYTLIRRLGTGGAAETWLASDRVADASVALKILVADDVGADALRREWQLAIRMTSARSRLGLSRLKYSLIRPDPAV